MDFPFFSSRLRRAAALGVLVATAAGSPEDLSDLGPDELAQIPIERVFGASRYEQKVTRAPSSVSLITRDEIETFGYRTLADLLSGIRGFHTRSDRFYTYLGVRGFNRTGDYNSRLLLLVDGHRLNDNIYDQAALAGEALLDIDLIERVEVIRGPSSSLYGNSAFFGVVNVVTRKPEEIERVETSLSYGTDETAQGRVTFGRKFASGVSVLASFSAYQSDGEETVYLSAFDRPPLLDGRALGLDGERSRQAFLSVAYRGFFAQAGWSTRTKDIPTASYGTRFNEAGTQGRDMRAYATAGYERELGSDFTLSGRVYWDGYDFDGDFVYDTLPEVAALTPLPRSRVKDYADGRACGVETKALKRFNDRHTLVVGVEHRQDYLQDQGNLIEAPRYVYSGSSEDSSFSSVYSQIEVALPARFSATAGVRHDHFDTVGDTVNPRLALIWAPRAETSLKLLSGTAFRAPNAYELYYSDNYSWRRNPDLKSERIRTHELVLEQYLTRELRFTASVFHYKVKDLIGQSTDSDGLIFLSNLESVRANGAEVEFNGRFYRGLGFTASYSLQRTENVATMDHLVDSPRRLGKARVFFPLLDRRLTLGVEGLYTAGRLTRNGSVEGYTLYHATLNWRVSPRLTLALGAQNLFDRRYADPAADEHAQDSLPQAGRRMRLKVTYGF